MADNTHVNSQITDAITQANLTNVGQAPGIAVGALSQSLSMSLSMMFANAVTAQQQMNTIAEASTARSVAAILGGQDSKPTGAKK